MTAAAPRTTVYVTNHNYGRYLPRSIESVLDQTDPDLELIVIDDGSTDDSRDILSRYDGDERVTVVFQENRGLNVTNNIALRMARGRYIMRLDADDYLDPNAVSVLAGHLDRHLEAGLVFPDYYVVDEAGGILELRRRHDFTDVSLLDQPAHGACTLIRTECLRELDGYDEAFRCQDGYEMWLRFIKRHQVANVNLPLFYYRQHGSNLTRGEDRLLATRERIFRRSAEEAPPLRTLVIVPVRGEPADPHSEALRHVAGQPLIDWTLQPALAAQQVDGVLVTTPDERVLAHVESEYGDRVQAVRRDLRLARPNTRIQETLLHALESVAGPPPDAVMVLYAESPFRRPGHLDTAINIMRVFGTDSVVSVRPETDVLYRHNGDGLEALVPQETLRLERDELHREAGQVHLVRRSYLEEHGRVVGGRIGHFVIDGTAAFRIRSEDDWERADFEAARLRNTQVHPRAGRVVRT